MSDSASQPRLDRRDLGIALALAVAILGLYAQTLGFDFVGWDDPQYVTANAQVRGGLEPAGIAWAFRTHTMGSWHPLTWLSHMLDVELFGLDPAGHHAVNAILHALSGVLLFLALRVLTGARWRSALVAALFGIHPLHVESVAWIAERKDVLSTCLGLGALWAYACWVRRGGALRYLALVLLFAGSLMSKPMLVTLPLILLLLDYWPLRRPLHRRVLLEKLPLLALSAACSIATLRTQELATVIPFPQRVANALLTALVYLRRALWPADLAMFYPHPYLPESGALPPPAWQIFASVFQDPEDQVVMTRVGNEVAFGLENLGVVPGLIWPRVEAALAEVGAAHLSARRTVELSGGELQRVCLASALAMGPQLLLLDEPTSQLDPGAAEAFLDAVEHAHCAVVLSEQRVDRALAIADRVIMMEAGGIALDAPVTEARAWLSVRRPRYAGGLTAHDPPYRAPGSMPLVRLDGVHYSYRDGPDVLGGLSLTVHRGEVVALEGRNGSGKTTLAKIAAGLLEPSSGTATRNGRSTYLSQDPGRYLVRETAIEEVSLGVGGDEERAAAALERFGLSFARRRHPRDLSSGERERLGLAAVSVSDPDLLVLDEPTRGIDPDRKAALAEWLLEQAGAGRGVLVATHDPLLPAHRRVRLDAPVEVPVAV